MITFRSLYRIFWTQQFLKKKNIKQPICQSAHDFLVFPCLYLFFASNDSSHLPFYLMYLLTICLDIYLLKQKHKSAFFQVSFSFCNSFASVYRRRRKPLHSSRCPLYVIKHVVNLKKCKYVKTI